MIPINVLQSTAETLMAKAAIEIPEDYLGGLRRMADTETGELSAFVIQAMLDNYEAATEDQRPMCADTGVPRWYIKYGNESSIEGGPVALESALRRATAAANTQRAFAAEPRASSLAHGPQQQLRHWRAGDRVFLSSRGQLGRTDDSAQRWPVWVATIACYFPLTGSTASSASSWIPSRRLGKRGLACQPAIIGVGLGGSKDISMVLGKQGGLSAHGRLAQSRSENR